MKQYATLYKQELLQEIIPFWETYSPDWEHGGYFTCITDTHTVFDTDKFIWLQARQAWMFSKIYLTVETKPSWKEMAQLGINFLEKYGRDPKGNWYFSLNAEGKPLVQAYNIFSDCFAAMAFGTFYQISGQAHYATIAKDTFYQILNRQKNPKGVYNKIVPGTRNLQNFALPMILCNLALELEHIIGAKEVDKIANSISDLILNQFYHKESGLLLENISETGQFVDSFEGRLLNPGHAIEAMWFIMNLGMRKKDVQLVAKAEEIMYQQLAHGWDKEYGGIFYFMDRKGYPPQQLEWNQKLWWVHLETLVALAKTYAFNSSPKAKEWFKKVHAYTWSHFRDPKNGGEWYGYLNRRGEVLLPLKGGKWKGCFHVPRAMLEVWKTLEHV
ncbi:AGE family epimerase/isomerase [Arenibacter sp. GZD96]|uniref:AGE family epimerase/isomerase n=1 Tax=Aurantibrevibacter litoralis TaxID=3106030 RepID=UPI002AFF972E|nr:AGE family epimerase/isomerase [Arenibacter sp. GZD-96]MEA1784813.1 AGE family epimerase/isomerase [Arenibacter sp. GZD-96]